MKIHAAKLQGGRALSVPGCFFAFFINLMI